MRFLIYIGWIILFLYIAGLIGCSAVHDGDRPTYQLSNGDIVSCGSNVYHECGVFLSDCDSGGEYQCQTNLKRLR